MIATVTLDGYESMWPIAYITATGDRAEDEPALIEEEFEQLKEKLADMAVAKIRDGYGEEEQTHTHEETPEESCDACDLDRRLIAARTELTGLMHVSWDDLPVIEAGARFDEAPVFGELEEKLEYVNGGGVSELGYLT